jgi:hypothetical protein
MNAPVNQKGPASIVFDGMEDLLLMLVGRWKIEKTFENFDDYATAMKAKVEELGGVFVSASKKPFGCRFEAGGFRYQIRVTPGGLYGFSAVGKASGV